MNPRGPSFPGLRVLVVEDEAFIAMELEEMLHELRCEIIATASTVDDALAYARRVGERREADAAPALALLRIHVARELYIYRRGYAGDTFNTAWHMGQLLGDVARVAHVFSVSCSDRTWSKSQSRPAIRCVGPKRLRDCASR